MDRFVATSIAPNVGAMLGGGHPSCSISRLRAREAARVETFSVSAKNMAIPTRFAISSMRDQVGLCRLLVARVL